MNIVRETPQKRVKTFIVRPVPRDKSRAILQYGSLTIPVAIGRNGRTVFKREGDGKTPIGTMKFLHGYYRADRTRKIPCKLTLKSIQPNMRWSDDPRDPNYNRLTRHPRNLSHEEMTRTDGLYNICLVLDWNVSCRRRNLGSAIFMHLIRPGYEPTAGCIALHPRDMQRLLPHISKNCVIRVL